MLTVDSNGDRWRTHREGVSRIVVWLYQVLPFRRGSAILSTLWLTMFPCGHLCLSAGNTIDFNRDIRPILSENCLTCHGQDERQRRAGLRLDQAKGFREALDSGAVPVVSGDLEGSALWRRVSHPDPAERMPPMDSGNSLTSEEVNLLKRWIVEGGDYQEHWAFAGPKRPPLPHVRDPNWASNPIDRFVLARLDNAGFRPAPLADPRVLLRRVSFDLRGVPASPAEVAAFLDDDRPQAYERWVNRWLASPAYGERQAQNWLDAARYADTAGHAADVPRTMWLYRDWVIDALNQNMPYDRFVVEQLAGDMIPGATIDQKIATGFHRNSMQALGNNPRKEEFRVKGIVDRMETTGRVFMGLTLACAECHDHKYDPLSTEEYYQLYAIFNNIPHYGERFEIHGPRLKVLLEDDQREWDRAAAGIAASRRKLDSLDSSALLERQQQWETRPEALFSETSGLGFRMPIDDERAVEDTPWGFGRAMRFEGGRDAVVVDEENPWDAEEGLTVSLWLKTSAGVADLVSKYDWEDGQRSFVFGIGSQGRESESPPGHLYAWISAESAAFKGVELEGTVPVNDGRWHHVALRFVPGVEAALFVDGQLDEKAKVKGAIPKRIADCDRQLVIGSGYRKSAVPNAYSFRGLLHDVRLYRRSVSDLAFLGGSTAALRAVVRSPASERSEHDATLLREFFSRIDPVAREIVDDIAQESQRQEELMRQAVTAQVMEEGAMPRDTHVHVRGNFEQPGKQVFPGTPAFLPPMPRGTKVDRLSFAAWLVDQRNPLTARVIVNRVWAHYFGQGLVTTLGDFGLRGAPPSHPDLLDWLAVSLMDSGWDLKRLSRLIVTSSTYRQSSRLRPELAERDPDNRYLARGPRFRLAAEQIRDTALMASGLLLDQLGGPSVYPVQPDGVGEYRDATAGTWETSRGAGRHRKSLYTFWQRTSPYPSLNLFDAPSRERSCVRRSQTNTPLQALVLLNDPIFVEMASALGARIEAVHGDISERVVFAFQSVMGRAPTSEERGRFVAFVAALAEQDKDEKHIWRSVAQVLLNLDETLTKE